MTCDERCSCRRSFRAIGQPSKGRKIMMMMQGRRGETKSNFRAKKTNPFLNCVCRLFSFALLTYAKSILLGGKQAHRNVFRDKKTNLPTREKGEAREKVLQFKLLRWVSLKNQYRLARCRCRSTCCCTRHKPELWP